MSHTNFVFYLSKILAEIFRDLLYFPIWWYSSGLWQLVVALRNWLSNSFKSLALGVWLRNLLVPMYGQRDFAGWAISIFIRLVQIIFRGCWFFCLAVLGLILIILWILSPLLVIFALIWQLT